MLRFGVRIVGPLSVVLSCWGLVALAEETFTSSVESRDRLVESAKFLADDAQEGRGVGTEGLNRAADYIAARFKALGLKTDLYEGTPFQKFTMNTGAELGSVNTATLVMPAPKQEPAKKPAADKKEPAPSDKPAEKKAGDKKTAAAKSVEAANPHAANPHGDPHGGAKPAAPKEHGFKPSANAEEFVRSLKLGEDFNPLSLGASGKFSLPLVIVGYGISAKDEKYDDYEGIDVKDKAVIVMRHEPDQANPQSKFNGTQPSMYAPYVRKISNAYEHGAAAVIFITDEYEIKDRLAQAKKRLDTAVDELVKTEQAYRAIKEATAEQTTKYQKDVADHVKQIAQYHKAWQDERDPLVAFRGAGPGGESTRIPVMHMRRATLDGMVQLATGRDLSEIEYQIEQTLVPWSRELKGCRIEGEISVKRIDAAVKNVVAVLEGEGPKADETVVIGAHYDHLGFGGEGSFVPNQKEIHNGADDNGSGTATLLEVARQLVDRGQKPSRRIVFITFTGEERGLIGSARYCKEPLYPLNKTIAMLNMDMVGRLNDNKLIVHGFDTAKQFEALVDELNKRYAFKFTKQSGGFGPSDHASFYAQKVPVMHFFTGTHPDYHRPTDDTDKLNIEGMARIGSFVADCAWRVASLAEGTTYVETKRASGSQQAKSGARPYFGSIPDFAQEKPGYALMGVTKDSPAEKGGLKSGDIIIGLGESRIGNLEDFDNALRKYKAGDKVPVKVQRAGKEQTFPVILDPPR